MERELDGHKVNGCNNTLTVRAIDERGSGNASHLYMIRGFNTETNPSCPFKERYGKPSDHTTILFQNGPIKEAGVNGVTHEVLLAVLIDRLEGFQSGPYACDANQKALDALRVAQESLLSRTKERLSRGVEGTHKI